MLLCCNQLTTEQVHRSAGHAGRPELDVCLSLWLAVPSLSCSALPVALRRTKKFSPHNVSMRKIVTCHFCPLRNASLSLGCHQACRGAEPQPLRQLFSRSASHGSVSVDSQSMTLSAALRSSRLSENGTQTCSSFLRSMRLISKCCCADRAPEEASGEGSGVSG